MFTHCSASLFCGGSIISVLRTPTGNETPAASEKQKNNIPLVQAYTISGTSLTLDNYYNGDISKTRVDFKYTNDFAANSLYNITLSGYYFKVLVYSSTLTTFTSYFGVPTFKDGTVSAKLYKGKDSNTYMSSVTDEEVGSVTATYSFPTTGAKDSDNAEGTLTFTAVPDALKSVITQNEAYTLKF